MWCLETIVAINNEMAKGHGVDQAYANCGISVPGRKLPPAEKPEAPKTTAPADER